MRLAPSDEQVAGQAGSRAFLVLKGYEVVMKR